MSERYLRQFIRETVLLESIRIDEALGSMLAAKKIVDRQNSERGQSSTNRSGSSKGSSYYNSGSSFGIYRPEPIETKMEGIKRGLKYKSGKYCWHVQDNWPDHMDWKEWLYKHEDGEKTIIKKQGNKYVINPDSIGSPSDGKFEQAFIDELEKVYEESLNIALDQVRITKHRGY